MSSSGATSSLMNMAVYDIDYYGMDLNLLETLCEGELTLAKRINI